MDPIRCSIWSDVAKFGGDQLQFNERHYEQFNLRPIGQVIPDMLFRPNRPSSIQIDVSGVSSSSAEVTARLNRIEENYLLLERMLSEVESMLPADPPKQEQLDASLLPNKPR